MSGFNYPLDEREDPPSHLHRLNVLTLSRRWNTYVICSISAKPTQDSLTSVPM